MPNTSLNKMVLNAQYRDQTAPETSPRGPFAQSGRSMYCCHESKKDQFEKRLDNQDTSF